MIYFLEDDDSIRELVVYTLNNTGLTATGFNHPSPFWSAVAEEVPELVLLDITEKEERERLRREFTANVSHELKTPLTSISGFAEIIRDGIAKEGTFSGLRTRSITSLNALSAWWRISSSCPDWTKTPYRWIGRMWICRS